MQQPTQQLERNEVEAAMVRVVEETDLTEWNAYVRQQIKGGLFHLAEWAQVFSVYRLHLKRLAAVRGGQIVGVLPLVSQRSLLFGNQTVSLPWFDAAGVLADDDEARDALISAAVESAQAEGIGIVQLRHASQQDLSASVRTDKVLMRLQLTNDPQDLWDGFSAKVRNQVRKAEKSGLVTECGGGELLSEFFAVYSQNMRDLGSPSHHRRFFVAVLDSFPSASRIYVVRLNGKAIGAGLVMANGDRLEIPWASSLREFNRLCVNHLMYWRILEDACRDGFAWFHFGRSSVDSGPYRFKKQWGAKPVQLYWYYLSADSLSGVGSDPPPVATPQDSYGWGVRLWRHLPVAVASRLGPFIISKVA